jgi:hypothetical protein
MKGMKYSGDHNYSIMLEVITDSEGNVICFLVQRKKNWIVVGCFEAIIEIVDLGWCHPRCVI